MVVYKEAGQFKPNLAHKSQIIKASNKKQDVKQSLNLEFIKSAEELGTLKEH